MSSLYDELGVPPDATDAEIKAAYHQKAKETHPDRPGGDEARFKALVKAHMVLSDPEKRARYDESGDADERVPDTERDALSLLNMTIERMLASGDSHDPLAMVRQLLDEAIRNVAADKARNTKETARIEKLKTRFKATGKEDPIGKMLATKLRDLRKSREGMDNMHRSFLRAREIAEGYELVGEPEPPPPPPSPMEQWVATFEGQGFFR